MGIDVFISHSSNDADIATALIELLHTACNISGDRIRCTSVDGYRLELGTNTDEQLRAEVNAARLFIGLITPASMQSAYVLFELGARWGAGLRLAPVLAAGANATLLQGPLSALNALDCSNESHLHQLVSDVATFLAYTQASPALYDRYLKRLVSISAQKEQILDTTIVHHRVQDNTHQIAADKNSSIPRFSIAQSFISVLRTEIHKLIVLAVWWILASLFLSASINRIFGLVLGIFSPFWIAPLSFIISLVVKENKIASFILGGMTIGLVGGWIGFQLSDRYGAVFAMAVEFINGAYFTSFFSNDKKQTNILWAFLSTLIFVTCLKLFSSIDTIRAFLDQALTASLMTITLGILVIVFIRFRGYFLSTETTAKNKKRAKYTKKAGSQ